MNVLRTIKKGFLALLLFCLHLPLLSGQLTLEMVLSEAREKAPIQVIKQIISAENDLQIDNINKSRRPQIALLGQASYQSEVTTIDIEVPGVEINPLSKDQYKIQAEINQSLYDGGKANSQTALQKTMGAIERQGIELELEETRGQIINTYFSILEIEARLKLLALKKEDLKAREKLIAAAVENGTLLKMEYQSLQAALLQLEQQVADLSATRRSQLKTLALLSHTDITENSSLQIPPGISETEQVNKDKAMYHLLRLQQLSIDQKNELGKAALRPHAGLFLQGGYGRPGLNFLKNEFSPYYIVGARVQWNLNGWYTQSNDAQLKNLGKEKIQARKEQYDLGMSTHIARYSQEIERLKNFITQDEELLSLREEIRKTAAVQVDNGVMTAADYLQRLNEANEAKEQKALHEMQLIKNQYLLQHVTGNYTIR